jgi:hypothetical protein
MKNMFFLHKQGHVYNRHILISFYDNILVLLTIQNILPEGIIPGEYIYKRANMNIV